MAKALLTTLGFFSGERFVILTVICYLIYFLQSSNDSSFSFSTEFPSIHHYLSSFHFLLFVYHWFLVVCFESQEKVLHASIFSGKSFLS